MSGSYARRQLAVSALVANALRPVPGIRIGMPSFFAGWLTGELAPHALAVTAVDTLAHLTPRRERRRSRLGLALGVLNMVGLGYLIRQSERAKDGVDEALRQGIGEDYLEALDEQRTPLDLATPWKQLVYPFRMRNPEVEVLKNIAYGPAGRRNLLDVYRPAGGAVQGAPVLLQVHGGGWSIGNKDQQGIPLMLHMAAKGWLCVAINYRLSPREAFPAHVIDVKKAIAWVKANIASYGGDPAYVAITGGSAGGHLSALAALTANDPAFQPGFEEADTSVVAAVPHYGVYDFAGVTGLRSAADMRDHFLAKHVMQKDPARDPEAFEAASPIARVTPDAPDFFVLHGALDTLVSVRQARAFVAKLREVSKATLVYAELPGTQHAFDVFPSIRSAHVVRAIDRYLHWHRAQTR